MVCIHCGSKTIVSNSRTFKRNNSVWRRRICNKCSAIFTTIELADLNLEWLVKNSEGTLSKFSRDKLFLSIYSSCKHRNNPIKDAGSLTDTVIARASEELEGGVISSKAISQTALVILNRFDKMTSNQYAAFHQR
jgi:transcriptional regulator NrdR family protein